MKNNTFQENYSIKFKIVKYELIHISLNLTS